MRTAPQNIAAVLTAGGRGAVATVGFCGDVCRVDKAGLFRAANRKLLVDQPLNRIAFGLWGSDPGEEVVVCRTKYDQLEIHCHGGDAATLRVLKLLGDTEAETVTWQEFLAVTEGPFVADASEAALAAAPTARTASIIAVQVAGPLRKLLEYLSQCDTISQRDEILATLDRLLMWEEFGVHLTQPWRVVLFGAPNVGKSSLINALVGFERAIVFDRPGTTRDVVTAETAIEGWPVRLSDTAGFRSGSDALEAAGIARAKTELATADLCVHVFDGSIAQDTAHVELSAKRSPLVVMNKSDLPPFGCGNSEDVRTECLTVSAKTGQGVRELMAAIVRRLVPVLPRDNEAIPVHPRQIEALQAARVAISEGNVEGFQRTLSELAEHRSSGLAAS